MQINVTDDNDNIPEFPLAPYTASVYENAQNGHVVKTVQATDADFGANAFITYTITSGDSAGLFRIQSDGKVVLQGVLDYETTDSYILGIKAVDGGNPQKSDQTTLTITVMDINESPSIKCSGSCVFSITEGANTNTLVGKVSSSDPDTKANCALQYGIQGTAKDSFSIDSNGNIKTKVTIDREVTPQYVFFVTVQDCGAPVLSDSVKMTVNVLDINDNTPKFLQPYVVLILENEIAGSKVVQVNAIGKLTNGGGSGVMVVVAVVVVR